MASCQLRFPTLPLLQARRHDFGHKTACFASRDAAGQEFVIPRVRVPYMCMNG
jgi:hypothetical protein